MTCHGGSLNHSAATAVGVDHVRLSYHYLNIGDIDGYGSLLDENVQVQRPDMAHGSGRNEVLRTHVRVAGPPSHHQIYKVIADGDGVAVTGRYTDLPGKRGQDFVDVFTLTDEGMLLGYRRFYYVAPD
ncbi:nuclear transport factor 2 family protein [Micromonospora sp. NPDC047134]|uniref:nuclear transport factor 2 family protein n=1 Tax=Micromonospora sp. NPDC047134 TaxID=3154340 RepID=UPI0033E830D2